MHSRIYQLSDERLPQNEWLTESDITESDMSYNCVDYVREWPERRNEFLENIAKALPKEVFKVEGDCITIVANPSVLWDKYKAEFISLLQNMEFSGDEYNEKSWLGMGEYEISRKATNMLGISALFYIMNWNEFLEKSNGLIHYAAHLWEKGEKTIYINGILDYHF